ncbi:hypothetical protein ACVBEQ_00745 [Nakamurella sp. GG22]
MADQPDVAEIAQTLAIIEDRDPARTDVSRFDSDHSVLLDMRDRVAGLVVQQRTDGAESDGSDVSPLLDRIENAIDNNRAKRELAAAGRFQA